MAGHLGQDWLLPAFLAPVLGGTLLSGGRVSVIGTLLGAVFVNVMTSGLLLMRVGEFWILASLGMMLRTPIRVDRSTNFADVLRSTRTGEYDIYIVPVQVTRTRLQGSQKLCVSGVMKPNRPPVSPTRT